MFDSINGTLLAGTATLVFVLLILIYRSPIFWLIPFFSVIVAEVSSRGLGYLLSELGVTVTGQSSAILTVLVFGAGTDYALLIVARYREELRRQQDNHVAVAIAMPAASPAIVASGLTVMAGLLCLSLAEVNGTAGLALIRASGIGLAMLVMCTLLPALLAIVGRRAFWPFIPRLGSEGADATHGVWRRIAERVGWAPRRVWIGTTLLLIVMSLGLVWFNTDLTTGNSAQGRGELDARPGPGGARLPGKGERAQHRAGAEPGRGRRREGRARAAAGGGRPGTGREGRPGARFDLTAAGRPLLHGGVRPDTRPARGRQAGGGNVLIGGPTAEERDLRESAARDTRVVVPIVLLVVFFVLAVLQRVVPVLMQAHVRRPPCRARRGRVLLRVRLRLPGSIRRCRCGRSCSWSRSAYSPTSS